MSWLGSGGLLGGGRLTQQGEPRDVDVLKSIFNEGVKGVVMSL